MWGGGRGGGGGGGGGDCLEMKCCQIILRFFWRFLMTQDRKKILMCLSFLC